MSISKASKYSAGIIHTYIEVRLSSLHFRSFTACFISLFLFFCLSLASFQTAKRIVTVDSFHAGRKGNFWKPLLQCYVSFASFIFSQFDFFLILVSSMSRWFFSFSPSFFHFYTFFRVGFITRPDIFVRS